MAFRCAFHMVSFHQTRDLECFAESSSIQSAHHSLPRPDCNSTADVPSFYSAHCSFSNPICFWSVWCRRAMIPGEIFTSFAEFKGIVSVNDFWFPRWLQELHQALLGLLGSFRFRRVCMYPLWCQIFYHHGILMIVPRFTFFTENLVIRCDQVTKMFRSGHDCTSTSSARSPCYFRLQADITSWVLRKMRIYTVLTRTRFHFCSRLHWKLEVSWLPSLWVSPRLCWSTFINQILSEFL